MRNLISLSVVGLLGLMGSSSAQAQVNAQLVSPVAGEHFFLTPDASTARAWVGASVGLSMDYCRLPLMKRGDDGERAIIGELATADLALRLDLLRRVRVELTLPMNAVSTEGDFGLSGAGDARGSFQVMVLDPRRKAVGLAVRPFIMVPTGSPQDDLGEGVFSPGAFLVTSHQGQGLNVAAAVGARAVAPLPGQTDRGDKLLASLSLSFPVQERLRLGLEAYTSTPLDAPFQADEETPVEILGTARYAIRPGMTAVFGAGRSATEGIGGSGARAFFQLVAAFPANARDRDRDGILDVVDSCPEQPEDMDGNSDADGCPDVDADGDGLADGVDQCPRNAEDLDGFLDRDGCPDPDNDEDGLADTVDKCPLEREDVDRFEDHDGCPEKDNDRDGFMDEEDTCINDGEDFDGFMDLDGCPDPDNDDDGVADAKDQCPNLAEDMNGKDDADGCPEAPPDKDETCARTSSGQCLDKNASPETVVYLSGPLLFDFDKAELTIPAEMALTQVSGPLKKSVGKGRLIVAGHCDELGTDDYNDRLSVLRAQVVRDYLISQGFNPRQLEVVGYGRRRPLVPGTSEAMRSLNRRVELWIVGEKKSRRQIKVGQEKSEPISQSTSEQ